MSEEFKILLATLEYPPQHGGVGRYYKNFSDAWANNEVQIITKKLTWIFWPHWLRSLWTVSSIIKKNRPHYLGVGQVLPLGYLALWLKRRYKLPYIVFTHGMDILSPLSSKWKTFWLKKILNGAELLIANSDFTKKQLLRVGVSEGKVVVVYPGIEKKEAMDVVDSAALRKKYNLEDDKIILSVGRLVKRKGFYKVIEILPKLLRRMPRTKYVIIGQGPEEEFLNQLISKNKLAENVLIFKNIDDEELRLWYRSANVFVMPCEQIGPDVEGFGIVFLEAGAAGLPVIAGASGGAPEAIKHGYSGFVIDPSSEDQFYQVLVKILSDEDFSRRLGSYAKEFVFKNFNLPEQIKKIKEKI